MSLMAEMHEVLEDLVTRYQVCWEVYPHEEIWKGERVQTGFDLELYGTHPKGADHPSPGCPQCIEVYDALEAIALAIVPEERRPSQYELSSFDQSIRYSHLRNDRPDVLLTITIAHRADPLATIDECEVRCLDEMRGRLRDLGAARHTWQYRAHRRTSVAKG